MFFSYGAKYPEKYEYWDLQPLAFVLEFYKDGFLGANLHYVNPDYRDGLAKSLINSGRGQVYPKIRCTNISILELVTYIKFQMMKIGRVFRYYPQNVLLTDVGKNIPSIEPGSNGKRF